MKLGRLLVGVVLLAGACQSPSSESDRGYPLADVSIERDGKVIIELVAEVARDEKSMSKGLQGVASLSEDQGMVFDFQQPTETGFWMKGVRFDLDIAFWDADGLLIEVTTMQTCSDQCRVYPTPGKVIGALETRAGVLRGKVKPGDEIAVVPR